MSEDIKQKILWIDVVSELGGAQHSMFEVCTQLAASGVTVDIAVPPGPLFDKFTAAGFTVYPISPIRASSKGFALFTTAAKLLRAPHSVNQIVKGCKADIVHANSLAAFMTTRHVPASIPVIWHVRDIDSPTSLIRLCIRRASVIITASEAIDEHFADMISPRHRNKLHLVRNGINPALFDNSNKAELRTKYNLPIKMPLIGMVAHLIPWKNHSVFIETAALIRKEIPEAHFVIVGKDLFKESEGYLTQLKLLAKERALENNLTWISDNDQPETIIPALDLLIHPARWEPFGRIICEAMASEVPAVAANSYGPATIITDKETGRLATDGTAENFAKIAVELLQNPQICKQLTTNAHQHVIRNYSVDRVGHDLISIYDELTQRTRERREFKPDRD